jgi:hypothetical protein
MCNKITYLAQGDGARQIACCEHGKAHLVWDHLVLRLPIQRLPALNNALQECAQVARHLRIAAQDDVCVVLDPHDQYQVWLMGVGLCLAPDDFHALCSLIRSAAAHPAIPAACRDCPYATPAPIRTPYSLFSLN